MTVESMPCPQASIRVDPGEPPEVRRFLGRLQPGIWQGLEPGTQSAIRSALRPVRSRHWIDLRSSIPLPGTRMYVTLLVGRERRNLRRLSSEGQRAPGPALLLMAMFAMIILASVASAVLVAGLAAGVAVPELRALPPLAIPLY